MEQMILDVQQQALLTLVRSGLTGECLPLPETFDLKWVCQQLKQHQVLSVGYLGAVRCGLPKQDPLVVRLFQCYYQILDYSEKQQQLIAEIYAAFDEAGVDYMPLKGCNLKVLYPAPELRSMGDADILIRMEQYDKIRAIMQEKQFVENKETDHELVWEQGNFRIELHKRLIATNNKDFYQYFGDGWRLAFAQDGTRWSMKREDEFVYLFAHFAKHYRNGGIGLRHLADLWVFLRTYPDLDRNQIRKELKKLGLLKFYENVMKTVKAWLDDGEWKEKTLFLINWGCNCGAFGTKEQRVLSDIAKEAGATKTVEETRRARAIRIVFLPLAEMKTKHPILGKLPILLPVFWIARIFKVLLFQRDKMKNTARRFHAASTQAVSKYQQELDFVGLNFNFEE